MVCNWRLAVPFTVLLVGLLPGCLLAYQVTTHDLLTPYELLPVETSVGQQFIVGELDGYPEMIEFTVSEAVPVTVALYSLPTTTTPQLNTIMVRVLAPRGVEEVARLNAADVTWEPMRDPVSRLRLLAGPALRTEVASGTYRVEVSTPENYGKYLILVTAGEVNTSSYTATWRAVRDLYSFAGVSKLGMVRTSLVYYPLLITVLLLGFGYTVWRTRERVPFLRRYG